MESIKRYDDRLKEKNAYSLSTLCQKAGKSISPYEIVSFQECGRFNSIFSSCLKSLKDLEKGSIDELKYGWLI